MMSNNISNIIRTVTTAIITTVVDLIAYLLLEFYSYCCSGYDSTSTTRVTIPSSEKHLASHIQRLFSHLFLPFFFFSFQRLFLVSFAQGDSGAVDLACRW